MFPISPWILSEFVLSFVSQWFITYAELKSPINQNTKLSKILSWSLRSKLYKFIIALLMKELILLLSTQLKKWRIKVKKDSFWYNKSYQCSIMVKIKIELEINNNLNISITVPHAGWNLPRRINNTICLLNKHEEKRENESKHS